MKVNDFALPFWTRVRLPPSPPKPFKFFRMAERLPTYSSIIDPKAYNRLMTNQHLYIAGADKVICDELARLKESGARTFAELGCGPARLLRRAASRLSLGSGEVLMGLDHDEAFLAYAAKVVARTRISLQKIDLIDFGLAEPVDVFFSQGFHHHLAKGDVASHLQSVRRNLTSNGVYVLGDEFLPQYEDERERKVRAVIWYAHIIDHAAKNGHDLLAREEAKTLIDDLNEGGDLTGIKTEQQIQAVLLAVGEINQLWKVNLDHAKIKANDLLSSLAGLRATPGYEDPSMTLSRGDFKIDEAHLLQEAFSAGFTGVQLIKAIGPYQRVGALVVYRLCTS